MHTQMILPKIKSLITYSEPQRTPQKYTTANLTLGSYIKLFGSSIKNKTNLNWFATEEPMQAKRRSKITRKMSGKSSKT